jgi:hypothetical protein
MLSLILKTLSVINHYSITIQGGVKIHLHSAVEDEWSASSPDRFISVEIAPGSNYIGECEGPKLGLNAV